MWNLSFISEEKFQQHVENTIKKYGEKLEPFDLKRFNKNKLSLVSKIDIENVLSLIPDEMLNIRSVTRDTKDLIYKLSFIIYFW